MNQRIDSNLHSLDDFDTLTSSSISIAEDLRARIHDLERQRKAAWSAAIHQEVEIAKQLRVWRLDYQDWLHRNFIKTAEAADLLNVSPNLLQVLVAAGPVMLPTADGRVVEVRLRAVSHKGYWFARDDIERILHAQRERR